MRTMETEIEKTEKDILKAIESGMYRNHFLVYNRSSCR